MDLTTQEGYKNTIMFPKQSKTVKELEGLSYEEHLRILGLFSLEEGRQRCDLIAVYTFVMTGKRRGRW